MDLGRLVNGERKIVNPKPENAGSILIFCEGKTEYNYLNYFKRYLEAHQVEFSRIELEEPLNAEGNAMRVYKYAEDFLADEENRRKYELFEKHLVFDCDAPEDIEAVLKLMKSSEHDYIINYSNLLFETWLVMHFFILSPEEDNSQDVIFEKMRNILDVVYYGSKEKASEGTIATILSTDGNARIRQAIKNAESLKEYWEENAKNPFDDIKEMNPSVSVHMLVERLLDEIEYCCK